MFGCNKPVFTFLNPNKLKNFDYIKEWMDNATNTLWSFNASIGELEKWKSNVSTNLEGIIRETVDNYSFSNEVISSLQLLRADVNKIQGILDDLYSSMDSDDEIDNINSTILALTSRLSSLESFLSNNHIVTTMPLIDNVADGYEVIYVGSSDVFDKGQTYVCKKLYNVNFTVKIYTGDFTDYNHVNEYTLKSYLSSNSFLVASGFQINDTLSKVDISDATLYKVVGTINVERTVNDFNSACGPTLSTQSGNLFSLVTEDTIISGSKTWKPKYTTFNDLLGGGSN